LYKLNDYLFKPDDKIVVGQCWTWWYELLLYYFYHDKLNFFLSYRLPLPTFHTVTYITNDWPACRRYSFFCYSKKSLLSFSLIMIWFFFRFTKRNTVLEDVHSWGVFWRRIFCFLSFFILTVSFLLSLYIYVPCFCFPLFHFESFWSVSFTSHGIPG